MDALRGWGFGLGVLIAACGQPKAAAPVETPVAPVATNAPAAVVEAAPPIVDAGTPAAPEAKTTPVDADGLAELEAMGKAAKAAKCTSSKTKGCDGIAARARNFQLVHCAADGLDPAYTFAWAARAPFGSAVPQGDDPPIYVDAGSHPKLVRVDEELYTESSWTMAEPNLSFETDAGTAAEQKRLTKLEAALTARDRSMHLELAVFYAGALVATVGIYGKGGTPPAAGGLAIGLRLDHPLCKRPQARVLPPELLQLTD